MRMLARGLGDGADSRTVEACVVACVVCDNCDDLRVAISPSGAQRRLSESQSHLYDEQGSK